MSGPVDIWHETAALYERRLAEITDEQWSAPTPCAEWDVRALVAHATGIQALVATTFGAELAPDADFSEVKAAVAGALAQPGVLDGNLPDDSPLGPMPKHQALGLAIGDLLIHTWDLSRAIGADETLPPAAVQAVSMGLRNTSEAFMRESGRFGPEVAVDDDADARDRLIAFAGRQP